MKCYVMLCYVMSQISHNIRVALQSDQWMRADISIYRRRWQPLSVHCDLTQHINEEIRPNHNTGNYMPYSLRQMCGFVYVSQDCVNSEGL